MSNAASNPTVLDRLRAPRIGGIAIFDTTLALVGGAVVGLLWWHFRCKGQKGKQGPLPAMIVFAIASIPIGVLVHALFKIPTALNHKLCISGPPPHKK